jgi:hypothetical protein
LSSAWSGAKPGIESPAGRRRAAVRGA